MIFDSIKRNVFSIISINIFIILLFWISGILLTDTTTSINLVEQTRLMPLQQLLVNYCYPNYWLSVSTGAIMVLILGLLLYKLNENHLFLNNREHLLVIVLIIFLSSLKNVHYLQTSHFVIFFTLLFLNSLFSAYKQDFAFDNVFKGALYLSISTLFYAPAIYLLIVFVITLSLMKSTSWRDYIILITGLFIPYLFTSFFYFFTQGEWIAPFILFYENVKAIASFTLPSFSIIEYILVFYILILVVFSLFKVMFLPPSLGKVKSIRANIVFYWLLFVSFLCFLLSSSHNNDHFLVVTLPLSVVLCNLFSSLKGKYKPNFIFSTFIILILAVQVPESIYKSINNIFLLIVDYVTNIF